MVLEAKIGVAVRDSEPVYLRFDEHTGIVGSSGAGKTVLLTTIMREVLLGASDQAAAEVWYGTLPRRSGSAYFTPEMHAASNLTTLDADELDSRLKSELAERGRWIVEHPPSQDYVFEGTEEDLRRLSDDELDELVQLAVADWGRVWTMTDYRDDPRFDLEKVPPPLIVVIDDLLETVGAVSSLRATLEKAMRIGRQLDIHLCWASQSWAAEVMLITKSTANRITLRTRTQDDAYYFANAGLREVEPTEFTRPGEALWGQTHFLVTPPP